LNLQLVDLIGFSYCTLQLAREYLQCFIWNLSSRKRRTCWWSAVQLPPQSLNHIRHSSHFSLHHGDCLAYCSNFSRIVFYSSPIQADLVLQSIEGFQFRFYHVHELIRGNIVGAGAVDLSYHRPTA
jgi:hypothetical protein